MLVIKNIDKLKYTKLNDWTIVHVFKEYTTEIGREYYIFQLSRTGGIASTTISLEKEASQYGIDLNTMLTSKVYEIKGPEGIKHIRIGDMRTIDSFIQKLKLVC